MDKRMLLPNVGNACRSLFGPVDHDEQRKVLHRELRVLEERSQEKWNFDFKMEKPLPGRWEYEEITEEVPSAYRMPQLSVKVDLVRLFKAQDAGVPLPLTQEEPGCDSAFSPALGPVNLEADRPVSAPGTPCPDTRPSEEELPVSQTSTVSTQTSPRKRKQQSQITGKNLLNIEPFYCL